jgi:hypothetical protein
VFLLLSLISVVPGLYFRPHYFVLLIPAVALGTGALVQEIAGLFASRWRYLSLLPILLFMFFLAQGIRREKDYFFKLSPLEACRLLYGYQPFPEAIVLGDYIRMHSAPTARVAVLGSEPEIYFYSRRHSATGYIYTYPLAERQPFADQMRAQMASEIAAARPQFIIQSRSWTSWLVRPGSPKKVLELCDSLMPPGYQLIASCDVFPKESRAEWNWHPDTRKEPEDSTELLLFQEAAAKDAQP